MSRDGLNTREFFSSSESIQLGSTGSADALATPDRINLYEAEYSRTGDDLVVQNDGQSLVLVDYFAQASPADLMASDMGVLRGGIIEILAGSAGDTRIAQASPGEGPQPIGQVEVSEGSARVQRTDGTVEQLGVGAKIYQQDVLITDADGNLSVTFADGTIFTLSASSRMVVDELIYDPEGSENSGAFSLVQGGFVFVAGQVAKTGNMTVDTPAATMGIRGTNVSAEIVTIAGDTEVQLGLNRDWDDTIGSIDVFVGGELQGTILTTDILWVISSATGTIQQFPRTLADDAPEQDLIEEAYEAFLLAQGRVDQGENWVDQSTSPSSNQNSSPSDSDFNEPTEDEQQEEENDLEDEDAPLQDGSFDDTNLNDGGGDNFLGPDGDPVANDVEVAGIEDASGNDPIEGSTNVNVDGSRTLSFEIASQPQNGSATINDQGEFIYIPVPNFSGTDSFVYSVSDDQGGSDEAVVTVTVAPVNDDPVAADDPVQTTEEQPVIIRPLANDLDVDGDVLAVASFSQGANGTVAQNSDGSLTYTPNVNFSGTDSFTYVVADGQGGSDSATVVLSVNATNDVPVASGDTVNTAEDSAITFDPRSNDSDADGDAFFITETSPPSNGNLIINVDGSLTYTPNPNFNGTDQFTYTVEDGQGAGTTGLVTVIVGGVNDPPVAADTRIAALEDQAVTFDPRDGDLDPDGDSLTVTGTSVPANGSVAINADGTLTYTPNPDFSGTDSFTYVVEDGQGGSDTATVIVDVALVNDPPVAGDDTRTTDEDQPLTFDPRGNDTDADGDSLLITGTSTPANGNVIINVDGTLTYTPDANFSGSDSFTYEVEDGRGGSDTATVSVTVNPVNDPPVATIDAATTDEDQSVTFDPRLNDVDPEGDPLTIVSTSPPANGSVAINPDGTLTYTPDPNFNGTDSFTYVVEDGQGGSDSATVTVFIGLVNDPPVAADDAETTLEDQAITFDPRGNDVDLDGDPLSITGTSTPANGTVAINANGTLTYTPNANFNGTDSFTYTISDGQGAFDTATVAMTITLVNDLPVATDDPVSTNEDQAVTFDPRGNDTDADGDPLTITGTSVPASGTVAINANGTLTYTPNANFNGSDSFTYTINDGQGGTDTATVNVTVAPVNDAPVAADDPVSANEDQAVIFDPRGNDSDVDGDPLSITGTSIPANGSVAINANGTLTYTPVANFNGSDSFTYTLSDGQGGTDTATVTVAVAAVNDAPVAADDPVSTNEDQAVTFDPRGNDSDVDGDPLSITTTTTPANGSVAINANGTLTYTPDANYNGSDSFTYTINDGQGGTDTATVNVTVAAVNDAPVAADDPVSTNEDQAVTFDPRGNDSDVDGDPLSITTTTTPANGSVAINANGTLTYTPDANYNGPDSFTYTLSDGQGGTDTATVNVTVAPVNDAPVATDDSVDATEDQALTFDPRGNDNDIDGDPLNITTTSNPANGSVAINANGTLTYTPDANYNGLDSFTYAISDGQGGTDTATVNVAVAPANDPPVAIDDSATTAEDEPLFISVLDNDSDLDGDPLDLIATTQPANGTISGGGADGNIFYHPDADFNGVDTFTYTVTDGQGGTDTGTVQVTVTPVNDDPVAEEDTATTNEDQPVTISPLTNDSDVDGDSLTISGTSTPTSGSVAINANGTLTYTPNANFSGPDSFTYTIEDGQGGSATAHVFVTVAAVNDPPVANDDSESTNEDEAFTFDPRDNDSDPEGDPLTILSTSVPANGSVAINTDGTLTYTPNANFNGNDSFTYTIEDGEGGSDMATVTIAVASVNDMPVANDDTATTDENQSVTIEPLGNDSDPDGDMLTISTLSTPTNGEVVNNGNGTVTYTPDANYHGNDSFTYMIEDGQGGSGTATVNVTVNSVNDDPVAAPDLLITQEGSSGSVNVVANDSDIDGDNLTVSGTTSPQNGSVSFSGGSVTYTPSGGFYGLDSFDYTVSDGNGGTDTESVTVVVEQDPSSLPPDFPVTITFDPSTPGNVPGTFDINVTSVSTTNINLVFAMDSSGSISQAGWNQQVAAVSSALTNLASDFSGSQTNVDVYIINYATNVQAVGKFNLVNDTVNLLNAVNSLPFQNGGTNWEAALDTATTFFSGEPSNEANILYFITDGNPFPTSQDWQGALSDLNSSVTVDIEAFAIGNSVNLGNLNIIDSDGSATSVTSTAALEAAFDQTPLFNAQMVDFSLQLNVDGADLGEIADINSSSLVQTGLNFELQLDDIPGLQGQLGSVNVFAVTAIFDLDGILTTTGDQVELFSVGTLTTSQTAGISASSATGGVISSNGGDLIPLAQNLPGQDPSALAAPDAQQLQGVMDLSSNGGNLPTNSGSSSASGTSDTQGGALGSTGFGDAMGGLLNSLALEGGEANSMPSA